MSCIQAFIADHFKVFFRDMANQTFNEIHSRDGFLHIFFIFVTDVVESNHTAIIAVDSGGGNGWPAKITSDIFDYCFWVTQIGFGINIEYLFVVIVTFGLYFFKGRVDLGFQFI